MYLSQLGSVLHTECNHGVHSEAAKNEKDSNQSIARRAFPDVCLRGNSELPIKYRTSYTRVME